MDFKTYYLRLTPAEREDFAQKAGTTTGYCNQLAYAHKQMELGMADVFVAVSGGALTLEALPLTERAERQMVLRAPTKAEA